MLTVEFLERDFSDRVSYPWESVEVNNYINSSYGGPKVANLTVRGDSLALWKLAEMMRAPVIISDHKKAKPVWWGYIESVTLQIDGVRRTVSIQHMANRVAVAYTADKDRQTTTFASDSGSATEYGKKEVMMSAIELTSTEADSFRDTVLQQRKYPNISVPLTSQADNFATIKCKGWWETLSWQYYSAAAGREEYTDLDGFMGFEMARTGDVRPRCAQSFTNSAGSNWDATEIYIRARKEEGGVGLTDQLEVYLYSDTGGVPNASLGWGKVEAADIGAYMGWEEFTLDSDVTLVNGTTYWIVVQNESYPSKDADDYYVVDGAAAEGYQNGSFMVYNDNSSGWEAWPESMDMNFKVSGESEITTQITNIITDAGEFILATDVIDTSGLEINPYRDGDNTAQFEIIELLNKGTTNDRRLLAKVLPNLHLEVYEEAARYDEDYSLSKYGIKDATGTEVLPSECPVGAWMQYEDAVPTSINVDRLSNANSVFVEEAEYIARTDEYKILKTRDISKFKDLFGMSDG